MHQRRSKSSLPRQEIGLGFLFVGLIFLSVFVFLRAEKEFKEKALSFSRTPILFEQKEEESLPKRIIIPGLNLNLPVFSAKVLDDKWEISETGASYLVGSGVPGKPGNMVIYGHNKRKLLGPIYWLKKGSVIKIENEKNEIFEYEVAETKTVTPKQIEVLSPTLDSTLTLYTCIGLMDAKRFIVIAKLKI